MSIKTQNYKESLSILLFGIKSTALTKEQHEKLQSYMYEIANPKINNICIGGKPTGYKISSVGVVYARNNAHHKAKLKVHETSRGLQYVILKINKTSKIFYIHELLADAFLHNPHGYKYVRHINGNPKCNWIRNIEWCAEPVNEGKKKDTEVKNEGDTNTGIETPKVKNKEDSNKQTPDKLDTTKQDSNQQDKNKQEGNKLNVSKIKTSKPTIVKPVIKGDDTFTAAQIIKACDLLEDDKLSHSEISRMTNIPRKVIDRISQTASTLGMLEYM